MSERSSIVRLNAAAMVNPCDWEAFKLMVAETKIIVAREGEARVLTHECYFNPETFECLIVEAYANEQALLAHLELIKPLSDKYKVDWKMTRLELLGSYSQGLVEAMRQGNGDTAFFYFAEALPK
jgi:hypothetical protein